MPNTHEFPPPEEAMERLRQGHQRFKEHKNADPELMRAITRSAAGQRPFAVVLGCMDSRATHEQIFDQRPGSLFSLRVAGHVVNEDILGSLEFACCLTGTRLLMVLGHSRCGAVRGACSDVELGNLTGLLDAIRPTVRKLERRGITAPTTPSGAPDLDSDEGAEYLDNVARAHVLRTMRQISERSHLLGDLVEEGQIQVAGAFYDVRTGTLEILE